MTAAIYSLKGLLRRPKEKYAAHEPTNFKIEIWDSNNL